MKWAYDLCGAEPIIMDEPIYDATIITNGQLLMVGATAFSGGADAGFALVNAASTTVASAGAIKAVGISLETVTTAGVAGGYLKNSPVNTAANTTNQTVPVAYAKTIVNPLAIYRTVVSQSTADILAVASSASTNKFAVTGVPASAMDGSWVYFAGTAGPNYGSLRKVVSSATAGTQNLDVVSRATITTADSVIFMAERNKNPHILSSVAQSTAGNPVGTVVGQTTVGGYGATTLMVVDNWMIGGTFGGGITRLKYEIQGQSDALQSGGTAIPSTKTVQLLQDLCLLNHLFNFKT